MKYGSVCSGIEAASCAWHPLGWRASFLSEIEPFPRAVLAHHYPEVPLHGDFTTITKGMYDPIDVLVGGTPCQSFSVAGLRKGLDDPRGNLMLAYLALADKYRPEWLVWENVPGVLSSNGGRDFGTFLGGLGQLGYGFAYRVLDAQYFGVAQRRRRVFVVGCLGDWRRAAAVLFERHSLQGHPAPRRGQGKAAPTIPSRSSAGGGLGTDFDCDGGLIHAPEVARCVATREGSSQDWETTTMIAHTLLGKSNSSHAADKETYVDHSLRGEGFDASEDGTGRGTPLVPVAFDCKASGQSGFGVGEIASTMRAMGHSKSHQNGGGHLAVASFKAGQGSSAGGIGYSEHLAPTLGAADSGSNRTPSLMQGMQVRRLTPGECESLQGFKRGYTLIQVRGKLAADGPRYKALGNSMAVPVMAWIGSRIELVASIKRMESAA